MRLGAGAQLAFVLVDSAKDRNRRAIVREITTIFGPSVPPALPNEHENTYRLTSMKPPPAPPSQFATSWSSSRCMGLSILARAARRSFKAPFAVARSTAASSTSSTSMPTSPSAEARASACFRIFLSRDEIALW